LALRSADGSAALRRLGSAWVAACRSVSSSLVAAISATSRAISRQSTEPADQNRSIANFHDLNG
jgi:hypothetical protein